jgi:hypothetical protein
MEISYHMASVRSRIMPYSSVKIPPCCITLCENGLWI